VEKKKNEVLFLSEGKDKTVLRLRSEVPMSVENGAAIARFRLRSGQTATFILEDASNRSESPSVAPDYVSAFFKQTIIFGGTGFGTPITADVGVRWSIAPRWS
jgi:hypothetical protein